MGRGKAGRNAALQPKALVAQQTPFLTPTLAWQCDSRQPLKQLADTLPWAIFETAFAETCSVTGRPAQLGRRGSVH